MRRIVIALVTSCAVVSGICRAEEEWRMGPQTAREMIELIRLESNPGRMKAAVSLGMARIGTPEALAALREMLASEYAPARASAVYALGRSGQMVALSALRPLLGDPDETVRAAVCAAFAELGADEQAAHLPFADVSVRVRQAAYGAAATLGRNRVEATLAERYLAEESPALRAAILKVLRRLEAPQGAAVLPRALADADIEVRMEALDYVAGMGDTTWRDSLEPVRRALRDPSPLIRRAAIGAFGRIGGVDAEARALALLDDADHTVRRRAAEVLGHHASTPATRDALSRLATDPSREVRRAGSVALLECLRRDNALHAELIQRALQAVKAATSPERREGLWLLGTLESKAGFPDIMRFGVADDEPLRVAASDSADGAIQEARLLAWIIRQTAHRPGGGLMTTYFAQPYDQYLRIHAARAIGVIRYEPAVPTMIAKLTEIRVEMGVRFFAYAGQERRIGIWALGEIGGIAALDGLVRVVASVDPQEDDDNLRAICDILVRHGHKSAVRVLQQTMARPLCADSARVILAQTAAKLEGTEMPPLPPAPGPIYDRFFLNVDEATP